ncbi:MAG: outer membrane lipoprotein chaperone LolA [Ignavibacteria bacterium]|nr:outer membrane lipoprotein chaperone LolA [Ignavibacteria bacterium]
MRNLFFLFFIFLLVNVSYSQDAQEIIKKVQGNYKDITDAKASFSQSTNYNSGGSEKSSGIIYIKKEDKYRIETKKTIMVTDGKTAWTYTLSRKQVVIDYYKEEGNTFSPNKFLFNYPQNFYSDLEGEENVSGVPCYLLKLTPRHRGNIKSAKIWIDKEAYLIRKITIASKESTTTYTLNNIDLDIGIGDSKFNFSTPQGVEVIDLR